MFKAPIGFPVQQPIHHTISGVAGITAGTLTSDDAGTDIYYTDDAETQPLVTQDA